MKDRNVEYQHDYFDTFEKACEYIKKEIPGRRPGGGKGIINKETNSHGFYYSTLRTNKMKKDLKTVLNKEEFEKENGGISEKHPYRIVPFYLDKSDNTTIKWGTIINKRV